MKIINPIYDNAFKYLMDNEQIAKIVLSIILDTKVISLQSKPQETPLVMVGNIFLSRFDFKAIIQNEKGENRTVLIEIQKYKTPNPVLRFRQYLAKSYMKEETIINDKGEEITVSLPIISIYILGFDLPEFNCKAIRVDNKPFDIIGQKELTVKSDFVEQLTHQCFILLAIEKENAEKRNTRLEKFLNLFIQKLQGESSNHIIDIDVDIENDPELKIIVDYLNHATLNEELVRRISAEKQHQKGIESLEKQVEEERRQKEEAKAREEEERRQKEEAKASEESIKTNMAKMMLKYGESIENIQKMTGLTKEKIEELAGKMNL